MKHYLKPFLLSVFAFVSFASSQSFAEDKNAVTTQKFKFETAAENKSTQQPAPSEKTPEFLYDKKVCEDASASIAKDLVTNTTCWKDEDCASYNFGYPWQKSACIKTIISTEKQEKNKIISLLGRIDTYKQACIDTNKDELTKYNATAKQIETESCTNVPLLCLKGVCRTSTYAVIDSEPYRMKESGEKK